MSELPRGWRECSLGTVAKIRNGYAFKSADFSKVTRPGYSVPLVKQSQLGEEIVDLTSAAFLPDSYLTEYSAFQVSKGDLLVGMSGAIGKVCRYESDVPALQNQRTGMVVPRRPRLTNERFLWFFLLTVASALRKKGKGVAVQNVSGKEIEEVPMHLPPLPEQVRIVAKLDELFSDLDAGVASLNQARGQLKVYRQAVLKRAFEGRLVGGKEEEEFHRGGAENAEGRAELPAGWRWERLEDVCEFITKGTTPAKHHLLADQGEIPFVKVYNLTFDGKLDFSVAPTFVSRTTHETALARSRVVPGDVLMNIVGPPLGKVSIVPETHPEWNINQAIARFRPKVGIGLSNKYLANYLLAKTAIEAYSSQSKATVGQINLTLEICRGILLPLPPLAEQHAIVAEIERRFSVADALEATIDQSLARAEALRQSLLQKAFRGELVPQETVDA